MRTRFRGISYGAVMVTRGIKTCLDGCDIGGFISPEIPDTPNL